MFSTTSKIEDYVRNQKLGSGTYGLVYKARNKRNNQYVAIKRIWLVDEEVDNEEGMPLWLTREITLLQKLQNPNIIHLQEALRLERSIYLVFDLMGTDLRKYINNIPEDQYIDKELVKSFLCQINKALLYCHSQGVMHRDVKPQNLLINKEGAIKLADFGLGRWMDEPNNEYTLEVVTLWYRAPELLLGSKTYSSPIDIWSMGCIFAEMSTKNTLFVGEAEISQLKAIFSILKLPTEETWPGVLSLPGYAAILPGETEDKLNSIMEDYLTPTATDLLEKMITCDPNQRITAVEIEKHPYFENVNLKTLPDPKGFIDRFQN